MKIWAGTSGYSYKEWKGNFYPPDLAAGDMLAHYGERLPAVEINNTFYRLPKKSMLETWAGQVPAEFRFAIKASRRITHMKRLRNAQDETGYLLETAGVLGDRLGAVLFQLPPYLQADVDRLREFLDTLPAGTRAAFEFRHASWMDQAVFDALAERNCALCIADTEDASGDAIVRTADWGYLRLRRPGYSDPELADWNRAVSDQEWTEAFVFFKHEDEGAGPRMALRLLALEGAA
jgi:uncharacterized protein YecE (DUF72 family)